MITSFPPIVNASTKILILGTMPGEISLAKQEYYGNKNNQFWKIIFQLFATIPVSEVYSDKTQLLQKNQIGLWDVLEKCERKGSLDSQIKNQIENDLLQLLKDFPEINTILFNGMQSHNYFLKKFGAIEGITLQVLPSTSPANTQSFDEKLRIWSEVLLQ